MADLQTIRSGASNEALMNIGTQHCESHFAEARKQ
jgi:hypothetical protein